MPKCRCCRGSRLVAQIRFQELQMGSRCSCDQSSMQESEELGILDECLYFM
jgi:hypothetical protein